MILVIAEQREGKLNRATWETIAAAQQLAGGMPITIAVLGSATGGVAQELASAAVAEVLVAQHAALDPYTPHAYAAACRIVIESVSPAYVLAAQPNSATSISRVSRRPSTTSPHASSNRTGHSSPA